MKKGMATKKAMAAKKGMAKKAMAAKKPKVEKPLPKPMAVKKGRSMVRGDIALTIAHDTGVNRTSAGKVLKALETVVPALLAKGTVNMAGIARLKVRTKKATKAGVRMMFGQEMRVAAKPARKVVRALPAKVLKDVKW